MSCESCKQECAICDDKPDSVEMCDCCRRYAYQDWRTGRESDPQLYEAMHIRREAGTPDGLPSLARYIIDRLTRDGRTESYDYIDDHGRKRGQRMRRVEYTVREIAKEAGCSVGHVSEYQKAVRATMREERRAMLWRKQQNDPELEADRNEYTPDASDPAQGFYVREYIRKWGGLLLEARRAGPDFEKWIPNFRAELERLGVDVDTILGKLDTVDGLP